MSASIHQVLKQYWGYDGFRPLQQEIIESVLQAKDTLALMPTGGGKSICFQLPALMKPGICIVVSPLIALMKDQIKNLRSKGIQAVAIYSGMSYREVDITLDNCIFGNIKFLYIAPERFYSDLVRERIKYMKVNLFAIDEAHCISQWGYDFRPSYLQLSAIREAHKTVPILALTASATPIVVKDIQDKLEFRAYNLFSKSFARENLSYIVLEQQDKFSRMLRVLEKQGGSGIIYVRNRRETQEVARFLLNHGISADFYHAGISMKDREEKQIAWTNNKIRVIVATNAFGMGIDKPDVRFVIHLDIPDSLESYYQEAGRAGRDQKKAYCVLIYQDKDVEKLTKNFQDSFPSVSFIQKVYHFLSNHYQIAYGAGQHVTVDFDIIEFTKKYKLDIIPTLSALKFLERDKWLSVSEPIFIPSRFKFEINFQELYKFQVHAAKYDPLIKLILRNHGGVFDTYVQINEYEIAKKLGVSYETVFKMLDGLQKQDIASYLKSTDKPQLHFLQGRVDYKNLYIDTGFIRERKASKQEQHAAILNFIYTQGCRSQAILSYFGEQTEAFCGQCDLCLRRNKLQASP